MRIFVTTDSSVPRSGACATKLTYVFVGVDERPPPREQRAALVGMLMFSHEVQTSSQRGLGFLTPDPVPFMSFLYIIPWVLPSVLIGVYIGYSLGRHQPTAKPVEPQSEERSTVLRALVKMLESTERLAGNVGSHNTELAEVGREVGDLQLPGEFEQVQHVLVSKISAVIQSNKRLEDDLVCTRYQLETQAQELDRTRHEARMDALSGIANRKAFDETLQYLLSNFHREQARFALLLLDVDHFKWINDTHGHAAGDLVVQNLANFLKGLVRTHDLVARFGGDEFVILFSQMEPEVAITVADHIRLAIARHNFDVGTNGERVAITCSLGLATNDEGDTAETIFARADEALYRSKRGGRNQFQVESRDHTDDSRDVPNEQPAELVSMRVPR
jgi:diguanylate cyclase